MGSALANHEWFSITHLRISPTPSEKKIGLRLFGALPRLHQLGLHRLGASTSPIYLRLSRVSASRSATQETRVRSIVEDGAMT